MTSWVEKYRPKTLDEVVGNPTAIAELRKWAAAWDKGRPDKRAVVLQGDPGIGKTSAALALANEMGWSVVEMNASESRNAEAIHKVATRGAVLQTFTDTGEFVRADEGGRKLIVLDEADNVFGREDRGGIAAIVEMIQTTQQPVAMGCEGDRKGGAAATGDEGAGVAVSQHPVTAAGRQPLQQLQTVAGHTRARLGVLGVQGTGRWEKRLLRYVVDSPALSRPIRRQRLRAR